MGVPSYPFLHLTQLMRCRRHDIVNSTVHAFEIRQDTCTLWPSSIKEACSPPSSLLSVSKILLNRRVIVASSAHTCKYVLHINILLKSAVAISTIRSGTASKHEHCRYKYIHVHS